MSLSVRRMPAKRAARIINLIWRAGISPPWPPTSFGYIHLYIVLGAKWCSGLSLNSLRTRASSRAPPNLSIMNCAWGLSRAILAAAVFGPLPPPLTRTSFPALYCSGVSTLYFPRATLPPHPMSLAAAKRSINGCHFRLTRDASA